MTISEPQTLPPPGATYALVAVEMSTRQKARLLSLPDGDDIGEARLNLQRTFHYAIPPALVDQVRLGQLVWVSFGRQRQQGIIVGFDTQSPVRQTKDLAEIAVPRPVLRPYQIELAFWISRTYLSPLFDCLTLMLPPGILQRTFEVVSLSPDVEIPRTLPADSRALLEWLRQRGEATLTEVEAQVGNKPRAHTLLRQLGRRGLLRRETRDRPPRIRPKQVTVVRLAADTATLDEARIRLGRESPQARALLALRDSDDPLPAADDLCNRADCTRQHLRSLAQKGWVQITPAGDLVELLLTEQELERVVADQPARAHRRLAALRYLRDHPGPIPLRAAIEATRATSAIFKRLEQEGIITRRHEPARAFLTVSVDDIVSHVYALRRSVNQQAILSFLLAERRAVPLAELLKATQAVRAHVRDLEEHGLIAVEEHETWRDPLAGQAVAPATPPRLTSDQQEVWDELQRHLTTGESSPDHRVILLHGVTGSGKTEIYLRAVDAVIRQGRQAIVLVPEIALTPQTVHRFAARFPERITITHSRLALGERYDSWRRVRRGEVDLVIGSRSAVFAPLPRPGLIVLDESHEWTYKQEGAGIQQVPHYHARDVAQELARLTGATVILGSATPDMESAYRARQGDYVHSRLPQRIMSYAPHVEAQRARFHIPAERLRFRPPVEGLSEARHAPLPPVQVVDLRQELRAGNTSVFSRALQESMEAALAGDEQVILFLNRRGSASFVLCRDCGHVVRCSRCAVTLTYHDDERLMTCHFCNRHVEVPTICPECWGRRIKFFGLGTQKLEAAVQERFSRARTLRWDRDTTGRKGAHQELLRAFAAGEANVLVGTQMIAKGLDLPLVTLVGVISADTALHLPDFRAAERTFQLLTPGSRPGGARPARRQGDRADLHPPALCDPDSQSPRLRCVLPVRKRIPERAGLSAAWPAGEAALSAPAGAKVPGGGRADGRSAASTHSTDGSRGR